MQIQGRCPFCKKETAFKRIHRTFIERVFRKIYLKYNCINCSAKVFYHCIHRNIILHRDGHLDEQ